MTRMGAARLGYALRLTCCLSLFAPLGGCDDETPPADAGTDGAPLGMDTGPSCVSDEECDDTLFCTGQERCEEGRCVEEAPPDCSDGIACTIDRCDEVARACRSSAPDRDEDGFGDAACMDGDGLPIGRDCDDEDADRFPGNLELCDESDRDEDCDPTTFGEVDGDGDGEPAARCCNEAEDGTRTCGTDCDDTRAGVNGTVPEVCNGLDDDCDGMVDEEVLTTGFVDADFDGRGDDTMPMTSCGSRLGFAESGGDCDDADPNIRPGAPELCDGVDNDCDLTTDESPQIVDWYRDADGDNFGSASSGVVSDCAPQAGYTLLDLDCDDTNAAVNPASAELCNGIDDDCVGGADFQIGVNDFEDDDEDGIVDIACGAPLGLDCDDADPRTGGGSIEVCDGRDNDCDENVDEGATDALWYRDVDRDGWGSESSGAMVSCGAILGFVARGGDCDDAEPTVSPSGTETCNGLDDDCNGAVDDGVALASCSLENATSVCRSGRCAVDRCAPGFEDCDLDPDNGCEQRVDDATACGCGATDCTAAPGVMGATCTREDPRDRYRCSLTCATDQGDCDGVTANGCETSLDFNANHCGGCGNACPSGTNARGSCNAGVCDLECEPGYEDCNPGASGCETPIFTLTDCGSCGNDCGGAPSVDTAACGPDILGRLGCQVGSCTGTTDDCNDDFADGCEVDIMTDDSHCGQCNRPCVDPDSQCVAGTCETVCAGTLRSCDDNPFTGCETDTDTNASHCGGCGMFCPPDHDCVGGGCVLACPAGRGSCDGVDANGCERDTDNDFDHCGGCGMGCDPDHQCFGGTCFLQCPMPFESCDGNDSNGCESDPFSDPMNCGGCVGAGGAVCGTDQFCDMGACQLACPLGMDSCDGNPDNGCETNVQTNPLHCGGCMNPCGVDEVCNSGFCQLSCTYPQQDCDFGVAGCETDVSNDELNCGGCNVNCFGGICGDGSCRYVQDIATGASFSCALFDDGTVACWGSNLSGQLGTAAGGGSLVPIPVPGIANAVEITAGEDHACVREAGGQVRCWGANDSSQIGSACGATCLPTLVPGLGAGFANRVEAGVDHTCAIVAGGTTDIYCWGLGTSGQLGDNLSTTSFATKVDLALMPSGRFPIDLAAGQSHSCMVDDFGEFACWGSDNAGQLGDGGGFVDTARPSSWQPVGGGSINHLASGRDHLCAQAGLDLYCWGSGNSGQTGQGLGTTDVSPVQVVTVSNVNEVATGYEHTCVVQSSLSRAYCFGADTSGALGNGPGATGPQTTPTPVTTPLDTLQLGRIWSNPVGAHVCTQLASDQSSIWCWGDNSAMQLGDGTTTNRDSPVAVAWP